MSENNHPDSEQKKDQTTAEDILAQVDSILADLENSAVAQLFAAPEKPKPEENKNCLLYTSFIVFSALLLVLVRPLCRRFLGSRQQATNADRIIGQTAVVTEPIDNVLELSLIHISTAIPYTRVHYQG